MQAVRDRITLEVVNDLLKDAHANEVLDAPDELKTTYNRLFSQLGEQMMMHPARFEAMQTLGLSPEQVVGHWKEDVSNAGRILAALSVWKREHRLAIRSIEGITGSSGNMEDLTIRTRGGASARLGELASTSSYFADVVRPQHAWDRAFLLQAVGPTRIGKFDQFERASTGFMLSQISTAMRNFHSATGRWGTEALDAVMLGIAEAGSLKPREAINAFKRAGDLVRLSPVLRPSGWVTPWAARQVGFEQIFDTSGMFLQLSTPERRAVLEAVRSSPEHAAKFLGAMAFDDQRVPAQSGSKILDALASPGLQHFLTMFNRSQEFTVRAALLHVSLFDQLRKAGLNPHRALELPPAVLRAQVGEEKWARILDKAVGESLDFTFAGDTIKTGLYAGPDKAYSGKGLNTYLIDTINKIPVVRSGYKFARFNLSAGPRYIWDHGGPVTFLADVMLSKLGRGRYFLGTHAANLRDVQIPKMDQDVAAAKVEMTRAAQQFSGLKQELAANRALQKKYDALPLGQQQVGIKEITAHREKLDAIERAMGEAKTLWATADERVKILESTREIAQGKIKAAAYANAPESIQQLMARNLTGAAVMLPIAMLIRAQQRDQGTKWHDIKVGGHVLDTRPLAPFTQYLFFADVIDSLYHHTDWSKVSEDLQDNLYTLNTIEDAFFKHGRYEGGYTVANIAEGLMGMLQHVVGDVIKVPRSAYQFYEGKYTSTTMAKEAANAFLSISQAAGTTLSLVEAISDWTERGMDLEKFVGLFTGAVGQMIARYTTPARQLTALSDLYDDNESHARIADRREGTVVEGAVPSGSALVQAAGNIPFLGAKYIPDTYNQLTGKPLDTFQPLLRALGGITMREWEQVTGAVAANAVPGQAVYIKGTKDPYLDGLIAQEYSAIVQQHMPASLESAEYKALDTPALRRDYLSRVFADMKKGALGTVAGNLGITGPHPFGQGSEAVRAATRWERYKTLIEGVVRDEGLEEPGDEPEPDVIWGGDAPEAEEPEPQLQPAVPPPG
jgi:hypothetical protein